MHGTFAFSCKFLREKNIPNQNKKFHFCQNQNKEIKKNKSNSKMFYVKDILT